LRHYAEGEKLSEYGLNRLIKFSRLKGEPERSKKVEARAPG